MQPIRVANAVWYTPTGNVVDETTFRLKAQLLQDGILTLVSYCASEGKPFATAAERDRLIQEYGQIHGEPLTRILDDYVNVAKRLCGIMTRYGPL